jgi:hypothetical protein
MQLNAGEVVVEEGTFLYAAEIECRLRVIKSSVVYGTGDAEDEPKVSQDQEIQCFYVEYGSTTEPNTFVARSQAFLSLQEALHGATNQLGPGSSVRWSRRASEA